MRCKHFGFFGATESNNTKYALPWATIPPLWTFPPRLAVQAINAGQSIPPGLRGEFHLPPENLFNHLIYNNFFGWHGPCIVIGG